MPASTRPARHRLRLVASRKEAPPRRDFASSSSQRVLDQGPRVLLRSAARAAADEYFDRLVGNRK